MLSRTTGFIDTESPANVAGVLGVEIGTPVILGRGFGDREAIVPSSGDESVYAGTVGRFDVGGPGRCNGEWLRHRTMSRATGDMGSAGGAISGERLGVRSGYGGRLIGGAVQYRIRDAVARVISATHDGRGRCSGRALAVGVCPDAVNILLPAVGGRAR